MLYHNHDMFAWIWYLTSQMKGVLQNQKLPGCSDRGFVIDQTSAVIGERAPEWVGMELEKIVFIYVLQVKLYTPWNV